MFHVENQIKTSIWSIRKESWIEGPKLHKLLKYGTKSVVNHAVVNSTFVYFGMHHCNDFDEILGLKLLSYDFTSREWNQLKYLDIRLDAWIFFIYQDKSYKMYVL